MSWYVSDSSGAMYELGNSLSPESMAPDMQVSVERAANQSKFFFYGDGKAVPEFFVLTGQVVGENETDLRNIMDSLMIAVRLATSVVREESSGATWKYDLDPEAPIPAWLTWKPQMNGMIADVTIRFCVNDWTRVGMAPVPIRKAANYTTGIINPSSTEVGFISLANEYRVYKVSTNVPARVRLYPTSAARDEDLDREPGVDPSSTMPVVLDIVTFPGQLTLFLVPPAQGFDGEGAQDKMIPISVENRGNYATNVAVSIDYVGIL